MQHTVINSHWLNQGSLRLKALSYNEKGFQARLLLEKSNFSKVTLRKIAKIWMLNRYKKVLTDDRENGIPFLMASQINEAKPVAKKFIAKKYKHISEYFVQEKWLLMTRSGTIGNVIFVNKNFAKFAFSEDLIRIDVNDKGYLPGFVYSFISSEIGKSLIGLDHFGSVVQHVDPNHIANLEVPVVSRFLQEEIHRKITDAYNLRDEANRLLEEADQLIYEVNGLPKLDEADAKWFNQGANAFMVKSLNLDYRLDGSYHTPIANLAESNLKKKGNCKCLFEIAKDVFLMPRFKRLYVDEKYGIPFLSGRNITQIQPLDLKFISKKLTKDLSKYIVKKNWILVTRSGTIGHACFVWKDIENYAATEHILRIIPDETQVHPGYLYAFISNKYGYYQIARYTHGSVVDEITDKQIEKILVAFPEKAEQKKIGEKVTRAYELRHQANILEDEAQKILIDAIKQGKGKTRIVDSVEK